MKNFNSRWIVLATCLLPIISLVASADDKPQNDSHANKTLKLLKSLSKENSSSDTIFPKNTFRWQAQQGNPFQSSNLFFSPQFGGKFWIGVQCSPASDELRSHLGLKKGIGLVVQSVSHNSPASRSKLQKHDILVKFGESDLKTIGDLTKAIQKTKGKNAKIVVIRKGKKQTVAIEPAERKGFNGQFQFSPFDNEAAQKQFKKLFKDGKFEFKFDNKQMEEMMKKFQSKDFKKDFDMQFFGPGVVMPFGKNGQFQSSNSSIMIQKSDNGKTKIRVQKDGKTWETTEDKLDKLPKDIRKEVERVLKNTKSGKSFGLKFQFNEKKFPNFQTKKGFSGPGFSFNNLAIMMTQTDGGKTKIKVMKDGKSWEVGEDELDKLPKEIRAQVKKALKNRKKFSRGKNSGNFFQRHKQSNTNDNEFQKKVNDLNRQVKELQKALENLKKQKQKKVSKDII